MSEAAVAFRERVDRARVIASADAMALGGLALFAFALMALTWRTWGDLNSDTGYDALAGMHVAHGQLPYADFVYYYGPLAPFLTGLAALVGGDGLGPAIALGFLITFALIAATYAVARVFVRPLAAFIAGAFTAEVAFIPNNYSFVLPHTYAATLGTLLLLLIVLGVHRYAATGQVAWLVGVGALTGTLLLTKPEPAAAALIAVAIWLLARGLRGSRWVKESALVLAPVLAIPAAAYGALLTQISLHSLVLDNLYPKATLDAGGNALVKARMPLTAGSALTITGKLVLYAGGCAALLVLARGLMRRDRLGRFLLGATVVGALLVVAVAIAKPDGLRDGFYYFYGWIPLGAAVALVVVAIRMRRRPAWTPELEADLVLLTALTVVAATTYGAFVTHGWRPQMAVYYMPLVAVFLVRLHLVELARSRPAALLGAAWLVFLVGAGTMLTLKDAHAESATVTGPGGALAAPQPEAGLYNAAIREIEARTQPGDPIFVGPLLTGLYVVSGRENPLRQISLLPSALPTLADQRDAIARLDGAGVRLAITDRRKWKGYDQGAFGATFDRALARWLHQKFVHVTTLSTKGGDARKLDVWARAGE